MKILELHTYSSVAGGGEWGFGTAIPGSRIKGASE